MSAATTPTSSPAERPLPRGKLWLFRGLTLMLFPSLFFLGLEGVLRLAGFGHPTGFLIPDDEPGYFRTNPDFVSLFLPRSFDLRPLNFRVARRKPEQTLRVVVLGESAAQGIPAPQFAFAAQLRAQLRARHPGRDVEVLNTGIVAVDSQVVRRIARDLAPFAPDLFVIYVGNNEVVGPFGPGCAYLSQMPPPWLMRLTVFVRSTRTGQLAAALVDRLSAGRRRGPEWGGMAMFANNTVRGDDPRLETVYRNFEANLRDLVAVARDAGARTLLCTVACNLADCAPLLSLHRADLGTEEEARWHQFFERGRIEWLLGENSAAQTDLTEAWRLDPQYADTAFLLGRLELESGEIVPAREHLVAAAHWDALRFRPDPKINEAVRRVARDAGPSVQLVDAAMLLGSDPASPASPSDRSLFFEHVHFDWEGNFRLARALAEAADAQWPDSSNAAPPPWLDERGCAAALGYTEHERAGLLQRIATIVQNPPFINQVTYPVDQARLARDTAAARAAAADGEKLRQAREIVQAAIARDPRNPALAKIAEDLLDDLGDTAGALAESRRTESLQPRSFALATDEAVKLARLGRFDEARKLLDETARRASPRDQAAMIPAYADWFVRTKKFAEGRQFLSSAAARWPDDRGLGITRGIFEQAAGDNPAAEREFRAALARDPSNQHALESLVSLLVAANRSAEVVEPTLAATATQPSNQVNNLRAALMAESRGDQPAAARYFLAAERSGPLAAAVELRLARKFFELKRLDDTLAHLGEAKRIAEIEGDAATTASIIEVIRSLRAQMPR